MAKTKTRPGQAAETLKPYVQRAIEDPELRDDLLEAFVAARGLYGQLAKKQGVKGKVEKVSDKDFQEDLQELISDLSEATDRLKEGKKGHKMRNRVILLTGVTLGVLYNPWTGQSTRDWIMERIAGGDGNGFDELSTELSADVEAAKESASSSNTP
jgi:soluble cytochrome b562